MRLPRHPPARPGVQRRTPGSSRGVRSAERAERLSRRTGFTSRAAVLALALCAVLLTLAVPLQQYVAQRGEISDLLAEERARTERVEQLEQARARWRDPAYVRQQARQRLHFVEPGETAYVIVDPVPEGSSVPVPAAEAEEADDVEGTWYAELWSSVQEAGASHPEVTSVAPSRRPAPKPLGPGSRGTKR